MASDGDEADDAKEDFSPSLLRVGDRLPAGKCITSPMRISSLCMERDGNVVLLSASDVVWSSYTGGMPFDADTGSLTLSDGGIPLILAFDKSPGLPLAWKLYMSADVNPKAVLEVTDACDLVLHADQRVLWSTGTSCAYRDSFVECIVIVPPAVLFLVVMWRLCYMFCHSKWHGWRWERSLSCIQDTHVSSSKTQAWNELLVHVLVLIVSWSCTGYAVAKSLHWHALADSNLLPVVSCTIMLYMLVFLYCLRFDHCFWSASPWFKLTKSIVRIVVAAVAVGFIILTSPYVQVALKEHMPSISRLGPYPECFNMLDVFKLGKEFCRFQTETENFLLLATILVCFMFFTAVEGSFFVVLVWLILAFVQHVVSEPFDYVTASPRWITCAFALWGRQRLEKTQHRLSVEMSIRHREMIQERIRRYEVEHSATEQPRDPGGHHMYSATESDRASEAPSGHTTATAIFFNQLTDKLYIPQDALADLSSLGKQEQWLVKDSAIEVLAGPENILGKGGFGEVRVGIWHGTRVAVKTASFSSPEERRKGLESIIGELHVLRHLRHPNIALCFGAAIRPGESALMLLLEFVDGSTLWKFMCSESSPRDWSTVSLDSDHCDGGFPSELERLSVMSGVLFGLRYLHERDPTVVHADIKPSNVMVMKGRSGASKVKLLDFGFSRMLSSSAVLLNGTRSWMAPEVMVSLLTDDLAQAANTSAGSVCRTAADIYSCGLLMYFLCTGRPPKMTPGFETAGVGPHKLQWPPHEFGDDIRELALPMLEMDAAARPAALEVSGRLDQILIHFDRGSSTARELLGSRSGPVDCIHPRELGKDDDAGADVDLNRGREKKQLVGL